MKSRRAYAAYLLGAYLSDGWLLNKTGNPAWQVADKEFADSIMFALDGIGSAYTLHYYPPTESRLGYAGRWCVREIVTEGCIGPWLEKISPEKECLPEIPRNLVRPLVAGLMDGDGTAFRAQKGAFHLRFAGTKGFVLDFYNLLEDLGVRQGRLRVQNPKKECYIWTINIEDFMAEGLNFAMPRKQKVLALWCKGIVELYRGSVRAGPLRKKAIASWWKDEVYSQDVTSVIPLGELRFKGRKKG